MARWENSDQTMIDGRWLTTPQYFSNRAVDELASVTPGKESRAMTSFANALRWSFMLYISFTAV